MSMAMFLDMFWAQSFAVYAPSFTQSQSHLADKKLVIILESDVHLQKVSDVENFGQHLQLICVVLIQLIQLHVGKLVQTTSTYG